MVRLRSSMNILVKTHPLHQHVFPTLDECLYEMVIHMFHLQPSSIDISLNFWTHPSICCHVQVYVTSNPGTLCIKWVLENHFIDVNPHHFIDHHSPGMGLLASLLKALKAKALLQSTKAVILRLPHAHAQSSWRNQWRRPMKQLPQGQSGKPELKHTKPGKSWSWK